MVRKTFRSRSSGARLFLSGAFIASLVTYPVSAGLFEGYGPASTFTLPEGAHGLTALRDGRLLTLVGSDVYLETAVGSRTYARHGALPAADFSGFGPAFLRVSPDGARLAVGNSGGASFSNQQVGVFDVGTLTGRWFDVNHFDGAWIDNTQLALTGGGFGSASFASVLDTTSTDAMNPTNTVIVNNIGGASGGIAFDAAGNLYTGNGFAFSGPSATGAVKFFDAASWMAAQAGGIPVDFEADGSLVVEVLSAAPLRFDTEGNLIVGGGDFDGGDFGYAALVRGGALSDAIAGLRAIDISDLNDVRRFDPDPIDTFNFYSVDFNDVTGELYVRDGATVYAFVVPEPAALLLLGVGALALFGRRAAGFSLRETFGHKDAGGVGVRPTTSIVLVCCVLANVCRGESPFASTWLEYDPAPGRWVLDTQFNNPNNALHAPIGGGTGTADLDSLVSLGGFGGSITLGFDHTVADDPLNPFGLDAIVFGNAIWRCLEFGFDFDCLIADSNQHWAECGTIEIARDFNGDGIANDPWYLIPGSHITDPKAQYAVQTWDEDIADPTNPPEDELWIPNHRRGSGEWQTGGYLLPEEVFAHTFVVNPAADENREGIYGYADYTPTLVLGDLDADDSVDDPDVTPEAFYTVPDDPFTIGISAGSGGGDAFDIAWAVNPATGEPADLSGFDFIRITTGVNFIHGVFGEFSAEIDAVADVVPDPFGDYDEDGDIDLADVAGFFKCYRSGNVGGTTCVRMDREPNGEINLVDFSAFAKRITGPVS